jgi:RNA polymerase sigma-32 factor
MVAGEDGQHGRQLFFNLRKAKSKISALQEGDMRPDQVKVIAKRLGVTEQDVFDMNRRLCGDASLNAVIREDGDPGEWQDWLVDESPDQETTLAASEEFGVSRERVRRIEVSAFEKVQKVVVKHRVAAMESLAALPVH